MSCVEPIRKLKDLRKVESILSKNPRDLLFFTIGTNCGLRISDILALNVEDVKGKNYIQIIEKKTGKFKKFPINAKLKPMLENFTKNKPLDDPLFMTKFKNRLGRVTAYYTIKDACNQAKLEDKFGTHNEKNFRVSSL